MSGTIVWLIIILVVLAVVFFVFRKKEGGETTPMTPMTPPDEDIKATNENEPSLNEDSEEREQ